MKKIIFTLLALTSFSSMVSAQYLIEPVVEEPTPKNEFEASAKIDLLSRYIWRGTDKGGITILPAGSISWRNLSFGVSSTAGFEKTDPRELNLSLNYQLGPLNVGVTDYWQTGLDYDGRDLYFDYDAEQGAHRFEANLGFTCDWFSLQAYTMFWGNDFKYNDVENALARQNGTRAFSTYVELGVPLYFCDLDWDFKAGITPFESAYQLIYSGEISGVPHYKKDHFYADGLTCIMASVRASKNFELGDVKLPAFVELNVNPYLQTSYFIVGMSVIPF